MARRIGAKSSSTFPTELDPRLPKVDSSPRLIVILGVVGAILWLAIGAGRGIGTTRWILIALGAIVAGIGPVARIVVAGLDRIRHPSRRAANISAVLIWLGAAGYFIVTAILQGRDLFPKTHDDCSYAIGMQMMARFRLWMPAHPLADFFDSFYIVVRPVYCSLYFPALRCFTRRPSGFICRYISCRPWPPGRRWG